MRRVGWCGAFKLRAGEGSSTVLQSSYCSKDHFRPCTSNFVAVMMGIKKMKPGQTCHLGPSYLLNWRGKKVGQSIFYWCVSFTDLSIIWLSFPLGKQVDGKTRLYQALCMFLTVLCLILLVVIIVLSTRGAYLPPWCGFLLKTNHCCHDYVCNTKVNHGRVVVFPQLCKGSFYVGMTALLFYLCL